MRLPGRRTLATQRAEALLSQMTLEEKIGQMTQVDMNALKDKSDIQRVLPRIHAQWRRLRPRRHYAQRLAQGLRGIPVLGAQDAAENPADLRH